MYTNTAYMHIYIYLCICVMHIYIHNIYIRLFQWFVHMEEHRSRVVELLLGVVFLPSEVLCKPSLRWLPKSVIAVFWKITGFSHDHRIKKRIYPEVGSSVTRHLLSAPHGVICHSFIGSSVGDPPRNAAPVAAVSCFQAGLVTCSSRVIWWKRFLAKIAWFQGEGTRVLYESSRCTRRMYPRYISRYIIRYTVYQKKVGCGGDYQDYYVFSKRYLYTFICHCYGGPHPMYQDMYISCILMIYSRCLPSLKLTARL